MIKEALGMPKRKKGQGIYSKPELIEYGKVEEITQGASGTQPDLGAHKAMG